MAFDFFCKNIYKTKKILCKSSLEALKILRWKYLGKADPVHKNTLELAITCTICPLFPASNEK